MLGKRKSIQTKIPRYSKGNTSVAIIQNKKFKPNPVFLKSTGLGNETKFIDTNASTTFSTANSVAQYITGVAVGTDFTNRIGRKVSWKSLQFRAHCVANAAGLGSTIRFLIVYDRQNNGALPLLSDVLTSATTTETITGMMNLVNRDRFWTVMDQIASFGTTASGPIQSYIKFNKKLKCDAQYIGTTNAIADAGSGAFFLFTIPDSTSGAANSATGSVETRLKFTDV